MEIVWIECVAGCVAAIGVAAYTIGAVEWLQDEIIFGHADIRALIFVAGLPLLSLSLMGLGLHKLLPPRYEGDGCLAGTTLIYVAVFMRRRYLQARRPRARYEVCVERTGDPGMPDWEVWKEYKNLPSRAAARDALIECRKQWPDYWFFARRTHTRKGSGK